MSRIEVPLTPQSRNLREELRQCPVSQGTHAQEEDIAGRHGVAPSGILQVAGRPKPKDNFRCRDHKGVQRASL